MNRMLRMKIQDGGRQDERCGFKYALPEKKSGYTFEHNETLLLISLYQKYEVFFSDVSYKKPVIRGMCLLSFVYRTAKTFGKSKTVFLFSSSSLFTRKIAAITAAMSASSLAAIFVTQCLLVSGPRISTGVFYADNPNYS